MIPSPSVYLGTVSLRIILSGIALLLGTSHEMRSNFKGNASRSYGLLLFSTFLGIMVKHILVKLSENKFCLNKTLHFKSFIWDANGPISILDKILSHFFIHSLI